MIFLGRSAWYLSVFDEARTTEFQFGIVMNIKILKEFEDTTETADAEDLFTISDIDSECSGQSDNPDDETTKE